MKERLIELILTKMNKECYLLKKAFNTVQSYAISDELKSEGKYDTRAVEAKYLADAQKLRLNTLESEVSLMAKFKAGQNQTITIGSIFQYDNNFYFILPISGQGSFEYNDHIIKTISYKSKLAQEVISLEQNDTFEHPTTGKEFQITKVV